MSSPDSPRSRRRIVIWVGLAVALLLAAGAGAYVLLSGGDVSNPDVEFRAEPTDTPVPDATKPPKKGEKDPLDDFVWAHYGYSKDRRRYLPASQNLRPPYYRVWSVTGKVLLEFGPVLGGKSLYLLKNNDALYAIAKNTGRVRWKRKLGYLAAASPAYGDGTVYFTWPEYGYTPTRRHYIAVSKSLRPPFKRRWSWNANSLLEFTPVIAEGFWTLFDWLRQQSLTNNRPLHLLRQELTAGLVWTSFSQD